ncbi:hypothetical protein MHU86_8281 [Fragilaria crotonensis]|nr:hypothetical protein MHU86_8281 [Fragilaria crotonensis]
MSSPKSNNHEHKRVKFTSSSENQIYWIQRRDSQKLSVRTEAALNRIAIMQQLIQNLREEINVLEKIESEISSQYDEFLDEYVDTELVAAIDAKTVRYVLHSRLYHLDEDIRTMIEDTLKVKRETKQLLALTTQKLRNQQTTSGHHRLVLSKRSLDVLESLLMEHEHPRAPGAIYGSNVTLMSPPETLEPTARCA